jgi:hypothetical protein
MKHNRLRIGVVGAGALLIVLSAKADTVDELMRQLRAKGVLTEQEYNTIATKPDAVDALMRQLEAKGILTKQEYTALSERHAAEAPPHAAAPSAPPPAAAPSAQAALPEPGPAGPFVRMMETGVGLHIGPVDVTFSGGLNAFYVQDFPDDPDPDTAVFGGLANVNDTGSSAVNIRSPHYIPMGLAQAPLAGMGAEQPGRTVFNYR